MYTGRMVLFCFFNEMGNGIVKKFKSPYNHRKQIKVGGAQQGYFWDASESWISGSVSRVWLPFETSLH